MTKRSAVQVLMDAGHSRGEVAAQLGVSEQAVRRFERAALGISLAYELPPPEEPRIWHALAQA